MFRMVSMKSAARKTVRSIIPIRANSAAFFRLMVEVYAQTLPISTGREVRLRRCRGDGSALSSYGERFFRLRRKL
jgi:hypothetical protein